MGVIRILLVDDHAAFREPLAFMLEREPDLTVVGQAGSLAEARALLNGVDVAVVDLTLDGGIGLDLIPDLRAANPHAAAVILSASDDALDRARAVEAGAAGILHKSAPIAEIMAAVRRLGMGEQLLELSEVVELLRIAGRRREQDRSAQVVISRLTRREREVLQALADGLNDREIAERLHISTETVRTHMVNILRKLGVDSRLQALVFAARHGIVKIV